MKTLYLLLLLPLTSTDAFAQCADKDFVANDSAQVTIQIAGRGYSPACLKVKPGTVVSIQASSGHPLQGFQITGSPANPFVRGNPATTTDTQTLTEAGRYGYFCVRHGDNSGNGMAGEIRVE